LLTKEAQELLAKVNPGPTLTPAKAPTTPTSTAPPQPTVASNIRSILTVLTHLQKLFSKTEAASTYWNSEGNYRLASEDAIATMLQMLQHLGFIRNVLRTVLGQFGQMQTQ
jgi:hypothetical protein